MVFRIRQASHHQQFIAAVVDDLDGDLIAFSGFKRIPLLAIELDLCSVEN
jgi:hypothetical protein